MASFKNTLLFGMTLAVAKGYNLIDTYNAGNWLDRFTVENIGDPTGGFVTYVDEGTATSNGYISTANNQVYMGVDHNSVLSPSGPGRNSIRLSSNSAYTHYLMIADIAHAPSSTCGLWPAMWSYGPNWPASGEIDIIENVNSATNDQMTLHTAPGCTVTVGGSGQTGSLGATDCGANAGQTGCDVVSNNAGSFGTDLNGVYATLWESSGIQIWYFPRGNIPGDITNNNPNPSGWGTPVASFGGCDNGNFDGYFSQHNIIFNIDFCGGWADGQWGAQCGNLAGTCEEYVAGNPGAFNDAYWLINSVQVYQ
ncbi:MAG: hypothetical protein M1821_004301 [Bathelium mastoideum]|nr:MAG: hypothetical protein M1821_004301 [Bathelium mastoideum]KAI9684034.1 MAG: hypothetical protein M1822_005861 [Bathelium mastoideum]